MKNLTGGDSGEIGKELMEGVPELWGAFHAAASCVEDGTFTIKQAYDAYLKWFEYDNSRYGLLKNSGYFKEGCDVLIKHKPLRLSLLKMAEELSELSTKVLQTVNNPDKVSDEDLLEEFVDVQMHLIIFDRIFNDVDVNKSIVETKINKMLKSADYQKYLAESKK